MPNHNHSLTVIYKHQTTPWVQFGYDLHMLNYGLGNLNIGYGLAVTPDGTLILSTKLNE